MSEPGPHEEEPPASPAQPGQNAVAEALRPHAWHLASYLACLVPDADPASLVEATLSSAQAVLEDPARLRAWLFALARRSALATCGEPGAADAPQQPADRPEASDPAPTAVAQQVWRVIDPADREILDLVWRHGIRPADLPVVLEIPFEDAAGQLARAEESLIRAATAANASDGGPSGPRAVTGRPQTL
jgi:DNA-directed RNA polymerase specialized sigma24 family protein